MTIWLSFVTTSDRCGVLDFRYRVATVFTARRFAAERVTRIELAWPAWKIALGKRLRAISACEKCPEDTADHRLSPYLMARYWPIQPSGPVGEQRRAGPKAAMGHANHLGSARGDPGYTAVVTLRFQA